MSEEQPTDQQQPPVDEGAGQIQAEGNSEAQPAEGESAIAQRIKKDPYEMSFLTPLPEKLELHDIPKINDARSQWRIGMRKVEEAFAEHIASMHLDFEEKAKKFEEIQFKLETNHQFLEKYYVDMQALLNEKYASIKVERDQWEQDKEEISKLIKIDSEIVQINVGGTHHLSTEKAVLQSVPGSTLAKFFSDMHELKKIGEEVFLDRDGKTFETLVNYLRNDRKVFPEFSDKNSEIHFYKELHFWGIDQHNRHQQEKLLKKFDKSFHQDYQDMNNSIEFQKPHHLKKDSAQMKFQDFKNQENEQASEPSYLEPRQSAGFMSNDQDEDEPGTALAIVKEKWTELGPLKLEEIVAKSSEPIDQTLQFGQSKFNQFIIGQIGPDGRVQGVGKEINHIIYEGQFKNDIYHGYGRYIYANGSYYIGNWVDGKRSGWGKYVDKFGKVQEGMWQYTKFIGN